MNTTQDPQNEGLPLDPNAYATKLDIANLRADFKDEISAVRNEIANLRSELKDDIANLRSELKDDIAAVRNEHAETRIALAALTSKVEGLEKQMTSLQNQMKMFFAFQTAILIALVGLFLKGMI